jgi:alkylation response protein AidB-like acyl-CoA dehydrogenase
MAGIGAERLHLAWVSSAEAQRFVEIATATVESVKQQGPLDGEALAMALEAADMTVNSETIRWLVGKEVKITTKGDVYGRPWDVESYEAILHKELEREYQKNLIILAIKKGFTSVRDISAEIGIDLLRISYLLADLEKTNMVEFTGMKDHKPVFAVL